MSPMYVRFPDTQERTVEVSVPQNGVIALPANPKRWAMRVTNPDITRFTVEWTPNVLTFVNPGETAYPPEPVPKGDVKVSTRVKASPPRARFTEWSR